MEITEERYAALEAMWARREQFSYNLGGLLLAYFRILWKRSNRYYCSEFVEDMLLHAEVRGAGELRARVVQPIHFLKLPHTSCTPDGCGTIRIARRQGKRAFAVSDAICK